MEVLLDGYALIYLSWQMWSMEDVQHYIIQVILILAVIFLSGQGKKKTHTHAFLAIHYCRSSLHQNHQLMRWERKQHFFSFLFFLPHPFEPHSTLSKALCATAPLLWYLVPWSREIFITQGPSRGTPSPFSFASSDQREEIALRSRVLTRRGRMKDSKRLIGLRKGLLMRAINSYQEGAFIQRCISKERITAVLPSACLQGREHIGI